MAISLAFVAGFATIWGLFVTRRLYMWERQLRGARIAVYYRGRVKMSQPIIDWLDWANRLDKDRDANGRSVYAANGTTVVIQKRKPSTKAKTITRKEGASNGRIRGTVHSLAQRHRTARAGKPGQ